MSETLVRFENAELGYGRTAVLSGVSCEIPLGSFTALVGPNGSGKTTFLRAVLGLLAPAAGSVETDRTRPFAYVPQVDGMNLLWPLTVRDAVALAVKARRWGGLTSRADEGTVDDAVARAGIAAIADRPLGAVSGGQRQRTVLAQALALKPEVLVLDEPARGLDVVAEKDFLDLISDLHARDAMTILFVTHSLQAALDRAERMLLFKDGRVFDTRPEELARAGRLEEIYGIPFVHHEAGGARWVAPAPRSTGP